jgi:hypothetical protein
MADYRGLTPDLASVAFFGLLKHKIDLCPPAEKNIYRSLES